MGGSTFCTLWKCIFQHFRWVKHQKISDRIVEIWLSVISTSNHMFKREIWDKFTEFTYLKF